ncbi:MAG TPA: hypothetical protein VM843_02675 [Flavisolibacter sp.]|nr:hypothetical protein [Flavisolibacter sp.]
MAKATKSAAKKGAAKRTTIAPNGDKRFIRRDDQGQIKESDDVGKSLSQDKKRTAKTAAKSGQGDKGDAPKKGAAKKSTATKGAAKKTAAKKSTK